MKARIQSVQPKIGQNGQQHSFFSQQGNKQMYVFIVALDNGTTGEVNSTTPGQYRFAVGAEVEYVYTPNQNPQYMGKLKLDQPGGGSKGWSPDKEARIQASGLVQAAIAAGAKNDQEIDTLVQLGMGAVKRWTNTILGQQPAPQPQNAHGINPNPIQYRQDAPPQHGFAGSPGYQQQVPGTGAFMSHEQGQAPF